VTSSLHTSDVNVKIKVLEILGAICLIPDGHRMVLTALDHFREFAGERVRFQTIVADLARDTHIGTVRAIAHIVSITTATTTAPTITTHMPTCTTTRPFTHAPMLPPLQTAQSRPCFFHPRPFVCFTFFVTWGLKVISRLSDFSNHFKKS
jgi:hypothetical protein